MIDLYKYRLKIKYEKNLFICSNLGILDTVLPFIRNQKEIYSNEYSILFTKPNTSKAFKDDVFLVETEGTFLTNLSLFQILGLGLELNASMIFKKLMPIKKYKF